MQNIVIREVRVQQLQKKLYQHKNVAVDVLRLDALHPVVSGNKWFKLKEYMADAIAHNKKTILTYGGAFSNHIVAAAAAAHLCGLQSVGLIRGEKGTQPSPTLQEAASYGMQLYYLTREAYKQQQVPKEVYENYLPGDVYTIPAGGYGIKGAAGAMDILKSCDTSGYQHIIAATGTGTMLAGLIDAAKPHQHVTGISVLKNNLSLESEIRTLLQNKKAAFTLLHEFHFGGYAKYNNTLLQFMNDWFRSTAIPTDFVYTAKTFFATHALIERNYFAEGSKILMVHSGGLQGNRSLPKGTLIF